MKKSLRQMTFAFWGSLLFVSAAFADDQTNNVGASCSAQKEFASTLTPTALAQTLPTRLNQAPRKEKVVDGEES